ncbi:MAG TPA: virulence RhuM family protein, partial [Candidatus Spyradenecus faecavium]|nr:virulence RhuM family protein [Candidatus Spyradenecus faecavium]
MKKPSKPDFNHSSAAEYLTFVAAAGDKEESFDLRYEDETLWMTQRLMAALYNVSIQGIGQHIKQIYADGELLEEATIKKFFIVQQEGTRRVTRQVAHYSLPMIIAVGFKVNSPRAVQFRKWANAIIRDFTVKGWA